MKTVMFKRLEEEKFIYTCRCGICDQDHSDTYVLASEAEAEIAELRRERQEQIDAVLGNPIVCCNGVTHSPNIYSGTCLYCKLTAAAERERVLREIIQSTISEEGHGKYCDAIKGPEPETWLVEEDCNCWVKYARAALAQVKGEK